MIQIFIQVGMILSISKLNKKSKRILNKKNELSKLFPAIGLYLDYVVSIGKNNSAETEI
jgi:hypothetical protein